MPGPDHPTEDVPLVPAPGADHATLPTDDLPRADGEGESPLVADHGREGPPGYGTDAQERGGPPGGENANTDDRGDA